MSVEVPQGWSVKPLGEIADLIMGQSPPSSAVTKTGYGLPFIQGNAEFGARHPTPKLIASITPKVVREGDVLISVRAPVGEVNIAEGSLCIGRGVGGIRAKECDPDFLFYAVGGLSQTFARLSQGSTFDAINGKELRSIEILTPPLDEQRRIAEVLRSLDSVIRLAEQSAISARATFNRLIDDLHRRYEDNSAPLADFCVLKGLQTGPFGSQLKVSDYVDEGISVIMPSDLRPEGIDFAGAKSTSILKADQLPQHHLHPGDILFSRRGDVEKCGLYLEGDPPAICGTGCLRARIDVSKADPVLIYFLAQSKRCGSWLAQHAVGVTMPNLNTSIVGALPIPNIPLPEQRRWVEALLLAEGACRVNENYFVEAQSLKVALSLDLLSGRVRVPA